MKASSGYVFDIKRFATHDGEGIRTTIFLKGCPLRCAWCQNPEGLHPVLQLLYMETKCMHCGSCAAAAIHGGVSMQDGRIKLVRDAVEDWEGLIDICPTGALRYDASCYDVSDILREVKKDRAFFRYGGGVTLSGGEPLLQADFALEILKACKAEGIHTTIETSLYAPQDTLRQLLPYLDHIYADLKIFDSAVHKAYTGVENAQILDNIRYLLCSEELRDRVIIRTPLIPEMIAEAIKQSGIMDKVGKLQGNAEQLARHVQQGVPTVGEYFDADPAFMREVEEHLGSYLTAQQKNYFDGDSIAAGVDLHDYFDGPDEAAGVDLSAYFVRKDS